MADPSGRALSAAHRRPFSVVHYSTADHVGPPHAFVDESPVHVQNAERNSLREQVHQGSGPYVDRSTYAAVEDDTGVAADVHGP